jgi:ArsR family transcriptional regulator, arsenate/arsenite/antimonite-responsive transcriptional repressor
MLHVNHLAQTVKFMIEHLTPDTVFKCLSDETRARMTLLIASEGELCVCELTTALEESQPKVSRHLSQLRSCAILEDRRQGQWVYYRLHPHLPDWVHDVLQVILNANKRWLSPDAERGNARTVRHAVDHRSTDRGVARPPPLDRFDASALKDDLARIGTLMREHT